MLQCTMRRLRQRRSRRYLAGRMRTPKSPGEAIRVLGREELLVEKDQPGPASCRTVRGSSQPTAGRHSLVVRVLESALLKWLQAVAWPIRQTRASPKTPA